MADMADYSIYLENLADNPPTDITLESARKFAEEFCWTKIKHHVLNGFVVFGKGRGEDEKRLVVYYNTGTVMSRLKHPKTGWRNLFRMHVDTQLMRKLFKNPREHTYLGYYKLDDKLERLKEQSWNYPSESYTLEYFICNIDKEMIKLSKLKQDLIAKTDAGRIQKKEEKDAKDSIVPMETETEKKIGNGGKGDEREHSGNVRRVMMEMASDEEESGKRGRVSGVNNEATCEDSLSSEGEQDLPAKHLKHGDTLGYRVSKDLRKHLDNIDLRRCTCLLALWSSGILYNEGEITYWTRGIYNHGVYKILKSESLSTEAIRTISIGSLDRYYISTAKGVSYWYGPKSRDFLMRDGGKGSISSVAFGSEFNSYVVMYKKGTIMYCNIPEKLEFYMRQYTKSKKRWPDFISMGPSGQFFIRFTDGTWKCGGMDEKDEDYLYRISGVVREVSFCGQGNHRAI